MINGFTSGTYGIRVLGVASMTIEHVLVVGVGAGMLPAIDLRPGTINGKFYMRDVEIHNVTGSGIHVSNASATLDNVFVSNAATIGLQVSENAIVNAINSRFLGSGGKGVLVSASSMASEVNLESTLVARSAFEGIFAFNALATVRLSNSSIFNNGTAVQASNSATIVSFGNNRIAGNTNPGSVMTMMPAMQQ